MELLPDTLHKNQKLKTSSGRIVTLKRTSQKDEYNRPKYRLCFSAGKIDRWILPESTSKTAYSRDELQTMGLVLYNKK